MANAANGQNPKTNSGAAGERLRARKLSARGSLKVTGSERRSWLNGLLTCDVNLAREGSAVRGLLLDRLGKIQSEVWVVESGDALLLSLSSGTTEAVQQELERRLIMEDAELSDVSTELCWYFVAGEVTPADRVEGSVYAQLPLFKGQPGWVVAAPRAATEVASSFASTRIELWSDAEWDFARIQGGYAEYGKDFGSTDRPHEAALDRLAVAWNKGCYLGQEVVCMQDMRGKVKHSLRTFAWHGTGPVLSKTALLRVDTGAQVGEVMSAARAAIGDEWLLLSRVQIDAVGSTETGLVLSGHSGGLARA
jgi:tRNA-modifying protein YgfZ